MLATTFQQPAFHKRLKNDAVRRSRMKLEGSSFLPLSRIQEWFDPWSKKKKAPSQPQEQSDEQTIATVTRLAARKYNTDSSKPSSRDYTTRKDSLDTITVTPDGTVGDYNHHRTVALKSTPDRAISILTMDVMNALKSQYPTSSCRDGDLGENVLLEGMTFDTVKIGQHYKIGSQVIIQVTEPMIPCANLCKLPYINDTKLAPKERIARCLALLEFLEIPGDGFRGWYAKVVSPGDICVGDVFQVVQEDEVIRYIQGS